jgi:hypothetical protein
MRPLSAATIALALIGIAPRAQATCVADDAARPIVQQGSFVVGDTTLEVVTSGTQDAMFGPSRIVMNDRDCKAVYDRSFDFSPSIRFETVTLAGRPVLHAAVFEPAASSCSYDHIFLTFRDGKIDDLLTEPVGHTNQGGLFVGKLGGQRGLGIARWDVLRDKELLADPHRYYFNFYEWNGERFSLREHLETRQTFDTSNDAATSLGLPLLRPTLDNEPC